MNTFICDWLSLSHMPKATAKDWTGWGQPNRDTSEKKLLEGKATGAFWELEKKITNIMEESKCRAKKWGTLGMLVETEN